MADGNRCREGDGMKGYKFLDEQGTFTLDMPENYSYQYFPIAGEMDFCWNRSAWKVYITIALPEISGVI